MPISFEKRVRLTQATVDAWLGKPFIWGKYDCGRLLASHLRAFGHDTPLRAAGGYKSAIGASAALRRIGCATMVDVMDSIGSLMRLDAPSFAIPGDIVILPSDESTLGAVGVYVGNGAVIGWHGSVPDCVMIGDAMADVTGAWHV